MERQVHARAEAEWQQALDLEKKLRACSRKRSFYDAEVRGLRKQLRDTYESLLFLDAAFAAANDVEGQMWRTVFYMPIEEFRTRIRKAEKEVQQQKAGAAPVGGPDAATILAKTAAAFLKFLDEAALFYKRLVMQLQSAYGDVKVRLELPPGVPIVRTMGAAADGVDGMQISTGSSIARDMRTGIHRCLVFLGDLSRYASQAAPKAAPVTAATAAGGSTAANTAAKAEWSKAVGYYRMAAHVLPRSGNPHNQLAVMAFMTGEELKAAYHYARSLCVHVPFMTARENLLQLLQNNRDRYVNLCKQRQLQQEPSGQGRPVLPMQQQLSELGTCYVRLVGLLYDRINQHEYPHVAKAAFESLAGFLDHPQLLALLQRQRQYDCTPLHMVVLSIFMVHHSFGGVGAGAAQSGRQHEQQQEQQAVNGAHSRPATAEASTTAVAAALNGSAGRDSSTGGLKTYVGAPSPLSPIAAAPVGTYGDAAQRSVQRGRALAMLFRTGRLLAQAATAAVNAEAAAAVAGGACNGMAAAAAAGKTGATNLLVGLNVVLQWLAAQPNCAVLQAATGTEEDAKARSKFWTAVGQLLLVLAPALNLYSEQQRQQQQDTAAAAGGSNGAAAAGPGSASAGGVSGSMGADASCEEGALPEDLELLGFEPMRSRHYWHVTDVGKHAVDETRTRIKRMLAAARVTSSALAAHQQAQLSARHISGSISAHALNQLGTAVQQFVEVVALVAASKTPSASPKVLAAVGQPGMVRQQQQQQHDGPTAMDIDGRAADSTGRPEQQGRSSTITAAATDAEECEEEEVIVFKPRISRLSSPALDDALAAAAAAAAASPAAATTAASAGGPGSSGPGSQVQGGAAGAAAGTPPLPQTLLAGRQPGSATASPTIRSAVQQQQQLRTPAEQLAHAAQVAAAAGQSGGSRDLGRPSATLTAGVGRGGQQGPPPAAAAAAAAAGPVSAGMLLQGHAATALDLQQAQAASDMLLARLTARQSAAGATAAAAAAPGFGGSGGSSMLAAQQQGSVGLQGGGASLANGFGGPAALSAGFAAPGFTHISAGFPAGGDLMQQQQQQQQQQQAGFGDDIAMEQALIGTGLATLLGGLGDELVNPSTAAGAAGVHDNVFGSSAMGFSGLQGLQADNDALAAVSAAVAASMQAAGLQPQSGVQFGGHLGGQMGMGGVAGVSGGFPAASAAAAAASMGMNLGLSDPLAALGMLGIPADALGLSVGIPGSRAGSQCFGNQLPAQGFGGFGDEPGGPICTVSASAAAGGAYGSVAGSGVSAGGRKVSAPVGILQQAAADAAADAAQQQQQLSSSYVANHQMEATALDAANRVLSPDMHESGTGLELLQQHQRQQQQGLGGLMPSAMPAGGEVGAMQAALPAVPSHGGSWLSGSTGSTPRATTPRGAGGLSAAFQQQQLQQAQVAQRRLSAGSASPRSAVGAERGSTPVGADGFFNGIGVPGAEQGVAGGAASRAGRMSVPSSSLSAAAAGGGDMQQQQQQRQQRSSIGAMFAGPDLFAPSEQLPPMHRRASSGSGAAAAAAGVVGAAAAVGGFGGSGNQPAGAAGNSLFAGSDAVGDALGNGMQDAMNGEGGFLPSFLEDVLQQPGAPTAAGAAGGAAPTVLQWQPFQQQQQQQLRVVAESPDQGDGGLTLVEYLAAQQRKLQQQGTWVDDHSSNGLQAAAATGADLSAHVLLPPLDFAESQNSFG